MAIIQSDPDSSSDEITSSQVTLDLFQDKILIYDYIYMPQKRDQRIQIWKHTTVIPAQERQGGG